MTNEQHGLFDFDASIATKPRFNGADYQPKRDDERLTGQLRRIYDVIRDGKWRTLGQIEELTGDPQPSISAQLRHLRKQRFGSHVIERRHDVENGLYQYRMEPVNVCPVCGKIGDPDDHGANCAEKYQVLKDFDQERA